MTDRELDIVRSDLDRVRRARAHADRPPSLDLGVAVDLLAEHVTYECVRDNHERAQELGAVLSQLSQYILKWGRR